MAVLKVLDLLLFVLHLLVIGFNLFGWIVPAWRKWHRWLLLVTLFSWLFMGIWMGWGYCFLTDWHWQIKAKLGQESLPGSFIVYLFQKVLRINISSSIIDLITISAFAMAVLVSVYLMISRKKQLPRN